MRTIIVGVDGSEQSYRAVRLSAELASKVEAKLVLAYVIRPVMVGATAYAFPSSQQEQEERKAAEQLLRGAFDKSELPASACEQRILTGSPAEALADAAMAKEVFFVVVGNRGLGAVKRMLLGSTADRLVHICEKPVLVVR